MDDRRRYRSVVADSARWDGFQFRPGDIVISTPPKCGTTWMQRLVALLVFDDVELPTAIAKISPWLDMQLAPLDEVLALLDGQRHRRFIKTHMPLDGVPYDDRVSYLCVGRDPRDVAVSTAHHMANMDIDRFMQARERAVGIEDLAELGVGKPGPATPPTPSQQLRMWIDDDSDATLMSLKFVTTHLGTCWERRGLPNVTLFHYQDMLTDLPGQLRRLADTLDIRLSEARITELADAATFEAMKNHAARMAPNVDINLWRDTESFFHRGTSGQWHDVFSEDDRRAYDRRVAELAPPDLAHWLHNGWLRLPRPTTSVESDATSLIPAD